MHLLCYRFHDSLVHALTGYAYVVAAAPVMVCGFVGETVECHASADTGE